MSVAGFLDKTIGLLLEQQGRVGLLESEEGDDGDNTGKNGDEPVHPPPAGSGNEISSSHGADAGS